MTSRFYGRYAVAEPPHALLSLHMHDGVSPLREVDWEPKNGVLDQSDLFRQGIRVSQFIPGAKDIDALGSCTFNANTSALSNVMPEVSYLRVTGASSYDDTVTLEKFAITCYHEGTDQTGDPSQEWPPTDCGSSGPYIVSFDKSQGWIAGQLVASGAQNIVSLMQEGGVLQGTPFFNSWEEPNAAGFVDGDGSVSAIQHAINSGVAGGHETYLSAIEKLTLLQGGQVDPFNTVLRFRNSWSKSWGDNGSGRIHLSSLVAIGQYCDFRRLRWQ